MNFLIKILLFPFTLIEKKETLFIFTEDDKIKLYLSDDLYWVSKFDKNSKIDVIKKTIKNRAFELKGLVFEVVSMVYCPHLSIPNPNFFSFHSPKLPSVTYL